MPKGLFVRSIGADKIRGELHAVLREYPTVTAPVTVERRLEAHFGCGLSWYRYVFPSTHSRDYPYTKRCCEPSHGELTDGGEYSDQDASPSKGVADSYSLVADHLFLHNSPELQKDANELFISVQSGMAMTFEATPSNPLSAFLV